MSSSAPGPAVAATPGHPTAARCGRSERPRLCFAIWSFGVGGAERMLIALLKAIPRDAYDLSVVTLKSKGVYAWELEEAGIPVHSLGKARKVDPTAFVRLVTFLRRERPDLLNTHLWTADLWGRLAAILCGVRRIVVTEHNVDVWKSRARRFIDRALFAFTDAAICVGDEVQEFYVREVGVPAEKTVVIPNAIDLSRFAGPSRPGTVRTACGLGAEEFLFACAARLHPQKAHPVLFEAVRLLRKQGAPPFRVLLVGDGPQRAALEELAGRLGLLSEVVFLGARTDVPQILADADAFALSSDYEGTSIAILEAMAASLPIVATDVGANRSVVGDGVAGLIVPPGDPAALAAAMMRLLTDPEAARAMGRRGREVVRARHSIESATRATLELFDRLLLTSGRRPLGGRTGASEKPR